MDEDLVVTYARLHRTHPCRKRKDGHSRFGTGKKNRNTKGWVPGPINANQRLGLLNNIAKVVGEEYTLHPVVGRACENLL
jgi:hypothetical protein